MKSNIARALTTTFLAAATVVLTGCTAMTTLPSDKLIEAASAVTAKPIKSVSQVRSVGDVQYFDALAGDGQAYACSVSVVFGVSYQHGRCEKK